MKTHVKVCGMDSLEPSTIILLEQVRAIDKLRIREFVCKLCEETMEKASKALKISLGLKEGRGGEKLGEIIKINNRDILMKEYMGQRVVTFKDIDDVHERPDGTANKRFIDNKKRFIEGEDYFVVSNSEIRKSRMFPISDNDFMDKTLITESGYYMLVKSFTDELAWKVQRELVKSYFNRKKLMSPEEMMRVQLGMIDGHEERITALENTMTIDYGQQRVLENTVNKTVIDALGGKESNAYKEISKKVFSECNRDLKNYFNVNSRNDVPKLRFDEAVEYAKSWKPCTNTMMMIRDCNNQETMTFKED